MLYLAYGSNLHVGQMARRCPAAIKIGATHVPDTRLVFRGVADIEDCAGAIVHVGVWHITPDCEKRLDSYEGVSHGLYRKVWLPVRVRRDGKSVTEEALIYKINRGGYAEPSQFYYDTIRIGYKDFGLPEAALIAADKFTHRAARGARQTTRAARSGTLEILP